MDEIQALGAQELIRFYLDYGGGRPIPEHNQALDSMAEIATASRDVLGSGIGGAEVEKMFVGRYQFPEMPNRQDQQDCWPCHRTEMCLYHQGVADSEKATLDMVRQAATLFAADPDALQDLLDRNRQQCRGDRLCPAERHEEGCLVHDQDAEEVA